ncbi:hypothetical protein Sliba_76320 [Streptomyces nigrescens]|uniref:Uncharacterized protein n=1 Tax=Streptomyces nigrescens TaxID=1920 RepID=A0A640TUX3_STRNI|nr:hypothetical protein Sliba_76320 [Streptomyces libani subsp. libani]GGV96852.1 hypothetical protein GCM10010500_40750 [Streptomyces libani subsp. libani]
MRPGACRLRLRRKGEQEVCHAMAAVVPHSGGRAPGVMVLRAAADARRGDGTGETGRADHTAPCGGVGCSLPGLVHEAGAEPGTGGLGRCAVEQEPGGRGPDEEGFAESVRRRRHGVPGHRGDGGRRAETARGRSREGSEGRRSRPQRAADGRCARRAGLRVTAVGAAARRAAPGGLDPDDPAAEGCDTEGAGRVARTGAGSVPGQGARAPTTRAASAPATAVPMSV